MRVSPLIRRLCARVARVARGSIFRLALLYVLLLAGSVVILLGFIYWSTAGYMDRQTTETIEAEIRGLAEQYRRRGLAGLTALIRERVARDPVGASVYLLVDERFERVVGNLDRWPRESPDAEGWIRFRLREWGTDHTDEHEARAQVFLLPGGLMLLVGRDVRDLEATRRLILDALTWGLAITLALALLGAWLMSASLTRRLDAINQTSREIMEGDLTRRIPLSGSGDDFDRLADGLNRMLERIEALMASVRQVSDNIAHDLRTPLTRLRNKLELLAAALPESGESRLLAEEAIADAEELLATFNALLRIARLESGSRRADFGPVDLVPLIEDLVELYEPLAAERAQRLDWTTGAPSILVEGDRDLLFQVMANLVDNAIKYTQPGGQIQLRVEVAGGATRVLVADNGPGIPPEFRERVFRRFFRIDDSRATPGSGLGLSLVQAVVALHRAHIELSDNAPGLRVTLTFGGRPQ
ncbi:sensor histidine kinase [Thermochromatium tepidum]|uniref:histidine kinase n=1 Tax=Thermochromatium tepidum ATCC 43061 TaxID=316276 RepID=A0A6I6E4C7_THETI|nr:HAMP domain-containing sensor histidine kinase [Thermochromatium tepidum]QGU33825.1 HAMP domain-containing protein [Thermochromatium tepidum ATCC 43061]